MKIPTEVWNAISLSELLVNAVPIYWYFTTWNNIHIFGFLGIVLTATIVELSKKYILPNWSRPDGASGCDLLCRSHNDEGKPGMPSGHTAMIAFFGSYYSIQSPYFWTYALLIMLSRYFKKCHTIAQIIVGLLLGLLLGYGTRQLVNRAF